MNLAISSPSSPTSSRTRKTRANLDVNPSAQVRVVEPGHGVEGQLHYLVAPVKELRPVWNAFQIVASFDTGDHSLHSAPVRIYDRSGIWVATQRCGGSIPAGGIAFLPAKARVPEAEQGAEEALGPRAGPHGIPLEPSAGRSVMSAQ